MKTRQSNKRTKLRYGYTTGTCAAAAARAAALMLLTGIPLKKVDVCLPDGQTVSLDVHSCRMREDKAICSIIKDAGDDPDITDGAEICAIVQWASTPGITLEGSKGVGRVTRPGLDVDVGGPAINRVPRQMIIQNVKGVIPRDCGVCINISVPEGEKLARKTLNRRLGIIGGISILGTTGIVVPYSVDAYEASITQALDVAVASGCRQVVLTTGRRSEKYAQQHFSLPEEAFVLMGDFVNHSLITCAEKGFKKVILWGMIGKLSKIARGDFNTNIRDSAIDFDFLRSTAHDLGIPTVLQEKNLVTATHFLDLLEESDKGLFCQRICELAAEQCCRHTDHAFETDCVMSTYDGTILGRGQGG